MISAPPVSVTVNGRAIVASISATLAGDTVVVPLDPYVRAIAARIVTGPGGTVSIVRGPREVDAKLERVRGTPADVVRLAPIVRGLGGSVAYDGVHRVLDVWFAQPSPLETMTPFVATPVPSDVVTFAPTSTPAPRPVVTGIPKPRRTPILTDSRPAP